MTIAIVFWGVSFVAIKFGLSFISPIEFLLYRLSIATIFFVPLALYAWRSSGEYLSLRRAALLTVLGLSGPVLSLVLLYLGMASSLASRSVLIMGANPLLTVLLLTLAKGKSISTQKQLGLMVAMIGLLLVVSEPFLVQNQRIQFINAFGSLLILGAAIAWSGYTVVSTMTFRKQTKKNSPITATALAFLGGTAALIPIVYSTHPQTILHPISSIDPRAIPAVLYLAIVSSILGFAAFDAGTKLIGSDVSRKFLYFQPIVAIPLAILFLGEPLTIPFLLGAGIIALGVFLTERNKSNQ